MSTIQKVTLEDTLYLIQLVRETALANGRQSQASRLSSVETEMRGLVTNTRKEQPVAPPAPGLMGQSDFKKLLEVSQAKGAGAAAAPVSSTSAMERNQIMLAMSAADMSDIDIARQFGVTRDEVRLVLGTQKA
jgi:hypothetical protein